MDVSKVLVPVHGNKADEEAMRLACAAVRRTKGTIYVIYVIEVKRTLPLDADISTETQRGEGVLDSAEALCDEVECGVEAELLQAREVGPAIVEEAVERGVDLIIMGVDYKKRFGEFDLSRTANYVLKNAPCRVWVCREAIVTR
ncbi:MAG: universal stress protein [Chloroflexi bacterium]|nr:universal stress protein [Chloroflexota bacterium]